MTFSINRRGLLAAFGSGAGIGMAPLAGAAPVVKSAVFRHGVASGDPTADGAVIWTRATVPAGRSGDVPLTWFVAQSASGKAMKSGKVVAMASADNTAKVDVTGLSPATEYWYWFRSEDGKTTPKGRFRTLPVGKTDKLVIALATCQLYPGGFFNAYEDMAGLERLDAVVHLGDYIYEYGADGYGAATGKQTGRLPDPAHEIITLDDYRRRHAQVKADPQMQMAHARAAFICVWDDHEVANDSWIGGAENHDPSREGDWRARKAAALQAYFEWMPIRAPRQGGDPAAIYRSFEFGDLATLAMVETRLLARSQQIAAKGAAPELAEVEAMLAARQDPSRELLGAEQIQWLEGVLAGSVKAGKPWQLLGNQVVMARVPGPDLRKAVGDKNFDAMVARLMSREAFGKRIADQSIWEQRVAEARTAIEMTRLLCLKAADMMDKVGNKAAKQEIAMIKVQAPNMALKIIDDAIQAHGGGGVSADYGLAEAYAHQRTLRLADGPDEVHARSIAHIEFARHAPVAGPSANALRGNHGRAANDASSFSSGDMGVAR